MQFEMFESMAVSVPVVATTLGLGAIEADYHDVVGLVE
jgi:hypothetical protein